MKFKRSFALILALMMCAACVLSSCDKLKQKDVEADPAEAVGTAAKAVGVGVYSRISPLAALKAAAKQGTVTFALDNAEFGVKLDAKSAYNTEERRLSGVYSLAVDDESVSLGVDVADRKIALTAPELVSGAYGFDLATLVDDLRDSGIVNAFQIDYDEVAEKLSEIANFFSPEGEATLKAAVDKIKSDVKATLNGSSVTVEKTEFHHRNGDVSGVYEVAFDLTKKDFSDLLGMLKTDMKLFESFAGYFAIAPVDGDGMSDFGEAIDKVRDELAKDENDVKALVIFDLSRKTGELLAASANGKVISGDCGKEFDLTLDLGAQGSKSEQAFGQVSVTSTGEDDDGNSTLLMTFSLDRVDTDKEFGRKLTVGRDSASEYGSSKMTGIFDFTNDKEAKTYVFTVDGDIETDFDAPDEADFDLSMLDNQIKFKETIGGKLDYTATTLTATVDTMDVEVEGKEPKKLENVGITMTVSAGAELGEMPEYKNIAKLDFEGLMDLWIELQNNSKKFTKIPEKFAEIGEKVNSLVPTDEEIYAPTIEDMYYPEDITSLYDGFDEKFDYDLDGKSGTDGDREVWEEDYRPYGEEFDESYDYDGDKKANTPEDREVYKSTRDMIIGEYDFGLEFDEVYSEFNKEYDYDGDGWAGTDKDRADYEEYYKPFADEFDPERDYDQDGVVNEDDRDWYDYIRSR